MSTATITIYYYYYYHYYYYTIRVLYYYHFLLLNTKNMGDSCWEVLLITVLHSLLPSVLFKKRLSANVLYSPSSG